MSQNEELVIYLGAQDINKLKEAFPHPGNINFVSYSSKSPVKRLLFDIPSIIEKYKTDYAHFQYIIPVEKKCRYIVTIHDVLFCDFPNEFPPGYKISKKILFRRSANKAALLTTVSDYSKVKIEEHLKPKQKQVHVIPNAVHRKFFLPYNKVSSQNYVQKKYGIGKSILYVSRFEPRKNHLSLLTAYLNLKLYEKGYYLVLLGHKSIGIPKLENTLSALPESISKYVFINNSINDDELLEFYRAASVFVYPSLAEGFGIPPLEAGALKIPVICSNSSALAKFSFFGDKHIRPDNIELLSQKLMEIITNPPGEKQLSSISVSIYQNYSWEKSAEAFLNLIVNDYSTIKNKISVPVATGYNITR